MRRNTKDTILARVKRGEGCWSWCGAHQKLMGYGIASFQGRHWLVHRLVYELLIGPIPDGLELDHLCRNRACCNPAHLEPVTHAENMRRGEGWAGHYSRATNCAQGHRFSHVDSDGHRLCKVCIAANTRRYRQRRRAA